MNWYITVLQKYAQFSGRARRSEYWYFFLFNIVITVALIFVDVALGTMSNSGNGTLSSIYRLGVLIPSIAVGVRRMHDVGKSGWFLLIPFYNLILACTEGERGDNEYGLNPKGISGQIQNSNV